MDGLTDARGQTRQIELKMDFLRGHQELAEANRRLLDEHGVTMIDIMGSVGTGKTSLVEQLARRLKETYRMLVLNGDLATSIDQERVLRHGVEAVQVNTGKECHLDAGLVRTVLEGLDLRQLDLVLVENVGNLICPADFPLGSHRRVVVISATEGPFVVLKHPHVFAEMDFVVINKIDLAPVMGIDIEQLAKDLKVVNPLVEVFRTSCRDGTGIQELIEELIEKTKRSPDTETTSGA
ncbi:MAG: hydrogenase nickel incorporation protein HypB [Chloroflexi bacterium]|nr:hydrogenase nickel incorporation protein HypB [Chloroflexota bacterium]